MKDKLEKILAKSASITPKNSVELYNMSNFVVYYLAVFFY